MRPVEFLLAVVFVSTLGAGLALTPGAITSAEFLAAKTCFIVAAIAAGWGYVLCLRDTHNRAIHSLSLQITLGVVVAALIFVGTPIAFKWVSYREAQMPSPKMEYADLGGYPVQISFVNRSPEAATNLAFQGKPDLSYDYALTDAQVDQKMASLKDDIQKDRGSRGDSEVQPSEIMRYQIDDPDGLAMKGGLTDRTTFYYIMVILEYRGINTPAGKWWITELCMTAATKESLHKCAGHNKIYLSD